MAVPAPAPSPAPPGGPGARRLLLFTKPAREGRVKTRLIGDLTPRQAADLHAAFLADLLVRLGRGRFDLHLAWALEPGEGMPPSSFPALRQRGEDLGERLYRALAEAAASAPAVAALGSDHPTLPLAWVERAFELLESGAQVVLGPAEDGGYYLIALAAGAVVPRLFEAIPWSTAGVLAATLARCHELGLGVEMLPSACDVDTPRDLERLAGQMAAGDLDCPRTHQLLAAWHRLPPTAPAASAAHAPAASGSAALAPTASAPPASTP